MKNRIALGFIAMMMILSLSASAQDWRYERYQRYGYQPYSRDRGDRVLFRQGFDSGYRCTTTGRDCQTEWKTRHMSLDDRRAFEQGFHRGVEQARIDNGWRPR